jgi:K+-transporting ATPase ATPase C chain
MWRHTKIAVKLVFLTVILLGLVYPLVITGLAQVMFPSQADGSLARKGDRVVGSTLIGQQFTRPEYFHPRPSAAGRGYDATASGGSNLGPTSRVLAQRVRGDVARLAKQEPGLRPGRVPVDVVTASASGLDPDITLASAEVQVARVAKARGISQDEVRRIIRSVQSDRQFGLLGEPRVNVLRLSLALDAGGTTRP